MNVQVRLCPPLNSAAGQNWVEFSLDSAATIQTLLDKLVERFGTSVHRCLFDEVGRIIPAWCASIERSPAIHFNRPEAMATPLKDGDEIWLLLALAGG